MYVRRVLVKVILARRGGPINYTYRAPPHRLTYLCRFVFCGVTFIVILTALLLMTSSSIVITGSIILIPKTTTTIHQLIELQSIQRHIHHLIGRIFVIIGTWSGLGPTRLPSNGIAVVS